MGVGVDPAQAHSLRILASPDTHVDGEGGFLHPPRCAPKPLRKARVPLSTHISDGTMLPGAPAQVVPVPRDAARLSPFRLATNNTLPPRKLVGLTGFACVGQGLDLYMQCVSSSAPSPVPALGPPKGLPTPSQSSPWFGLAHGAELNAARLTHRNASAGEALLWIATIPPPAPAAGSGPPSILSLVPCPPVTHASPSLLRACPRLCLSMTRPLLLLLRCSSLSRPPLRPQPSHQQTSFP